MTDVFEHLNLIIFFGLLAFATHWIAKNKGFFSFPSPLEKDKVPALRLRQVCVPFLIYLVISLAIIPFLARWTVAHTSTSSLAATALFQLINIALILFFVALYSLRQDRTTMKRIWKDRERITCHSIAYDFGLGVLTWLLSFPLVAAVGQVCDILIYVLFGVESYEQVAVRYLKMVLQSPLLLPVALSAIILLAPILEEWLFRGFLQTFFKRHVGAKAAILLSSLCFALFHLSASQGAGNLPLAVSLFIFGGYLGFLYERQGSLFASIGLHMTFNAISSIRIFFSP